MKSLICLVAIDAAPASLLSGISLDDPITLIPLFGVFFLGLALGGLLFRQRSQETAPDLAVDAPAPDPKDDSVLQPLNASPGEVSPVVASGADGVPATLEGELAALRRHAEIQAAEIQVLGERFAAQRQDFDERRRRIGEVSLSEEHAAGLPRHHAVLNHALPPVAHLAEAIRVELGRMGGHLSRLARLEARLRDEDRRFREAGDSLARARDEVGGRLSDTTGTEPAKFALADRLSQADDQLQALGQGISGCLARVVSTQEHLKLAESRLREAAGPVHEAETLLGAETVVAAEVAPALADARARLGQARGQLANLEEGIDREISEAIGRVDWVVRESPSGFLNALDRLHGADFGSDQGAGQIRSRVWRELSELRGALSGIQVTLEAGAFAAPPEGGGKHQLVEAADRALAAVEAAGKRPVAEEVPIPESQGATEIAKLRQEALQREAEIGSLREALADLEEQVSRRLPFDLGEEAGIAGLVAAEIEPGVAESSRPGSSRQFIRRLLGLGPGRWEADLDTSGLLAGSAAPVALATLAEARAVVTELRRVPVSAPDAVPSSHQSGHHGLPLAVSAPPSPAGGADESESEIRRLKAELAGRDARISSLEALLAASPQGPTDAGTDLATLFPWPEISGGMVGIGAGAWAGQAIGDPGDGFEFSVGPAGGWAAETPSSGLEPGAAFLVAGPDGTEPTISQAPGDLDALATQSENRIDGLVLFRANDPSLWRRDLYTGANRRSRSLDHLPSGLAFLRLRRIDTGEGIVVPVTNAQLLDDGDGLPRGFNGANEFFYGAYHLGVFDESVPQEFETRFTFGGWGFGHTVAGSESQASGWEGLPIPSRTVFEIAVFRRMPVLGEKDRLLGEGR